MKGRRDAALVVAVVMMVVMMMAPTAAGERRALLLALDGTRGDVFMHLFGDGSLPNLASLNNSLAFTRCKSVEDRDCARAHDLELGMVWVTAVGWASVTTGMNVKHNVKNNDPSKQAPFADSTQTHPTFLAYARKHNLKTAASGAPNFLSSHTLDNKSQDYGVIDYECGVGKDDKPIVKPSASTSCNLVNRAGQSSDDDDRDAKTTQFAIQNIRDGTEVIIAHFDLIDEAGHTHGFGLTAEYIKAITVVDKHIGDILAEVRKSKDEFLIVVTSDHGGHLKSHDFVPEFDSCVPFLVATVNSNLNIGQGVALGKGVHHYDAMPTILTWLSIPYSRVDGVPRGISASRHHN